jgi:hypothetical protein
MGSFCEHADEFSCSSEADIIVSQTNPIQIFTSYLFKIIFTVVLSSTPRSPKYSLPIIFQH